MWILSIFGSILGPLCYPFAPFLVSRVVLLLSFVVQIWRAWLFFVLWCGPWLARLAQCANLIAFMLFAGHACFEFVPAVSSLRITAVRTALTIAFGVLQKKQVTQTALNIFGPLGDVWQPLGVQQCCYHAGAFRNVGEEDPKGLAGWAACCSYIWNISGTLSAKAPQRWMKSCRSH